MGISVIIITTAAEAPAACWDAARSPAACCAGILYIYIYNYINKYMDR